MKKIILNSIELAIQKEVEPRFVILLLVYYSRALKLLKNCGIKHVTIPYNRHLRYLCPVDQSCDWYHITHEIVILNKEFVPKEGEVVVDIGSNIGLQAMYCAWKVGPKGLVIAVEPDPRNFAYLLRNKLLNGLENIILLRIAITDYGGKIRLYGRKPTRYSTVKDFALIHDKNIKNVVPFVEVKCKTLDEVLSQLGIYRVDLLNLDMEGAALAALKGSRNLLMNQRISRLKIEIENEDDAESISSFLQRFNYRVFRHEVLLYAEL